MRHGVICFVLLGAAVAVRADDKWGTVTGQVVWDSKDAPKVRKLGKGEVHEECLKNGPVVLEDYTVNPKNKGVRWVMVWLAPATDGGEVDPKAKMPVHKDLQANKTKEVVLNLSCCSLDAPVLAMREGQTLVAKNASGVPHNIHFRGGALSDANEIIAPFKEERAYEGWKASPRPIIVFCSIHWFIRGYIRVFDHPYCAVTDADGKFEFKNAPAGKYRLVVWHPECGWVVGNKHGIEAVIEGDKTTDFGKIKLRPE